MTTPTITTYAQFAKAYDGLVHAMLAYTPDQIGSAHFADRLADLVEAHPQFEARYDVEVAEGSR